MTIKFRNGVLRGLAIVGLFFFVAEGVVLGFHFKNGILQNSAKQIDYWWFFSGPFATEGSFPWIIVSLAVLALIALIMIAIVGTLFKNSISGEIFFFRLFLVLVPYHLLRLFNPLFFYIFPNVFPVAFFSRIDLFVFLMAVSSLFSASLIFLGMKGDKMRLIISLYTLIDLGLVVLIPINTTELTSSYLHKFTEERTLAALFIFLAILSVVNYLTGVVGILRDHALRLAGITLLIFTGYSFLYFGSFLLLIPGSVFFGVGVILYSKEKYKKDLWLSY